LNVAFPVGARARLEVRVARKRARSAAGEVVTILENLAFALEPGETGALIGPSGCGKTSLMRIVAGLDGDYDGAVALPPGARLAMVFQEPRLLPWRSVEDNLRLAAPEATPAEIDALVATLGLGEHRAHFPGELSLGLARRVALARAFALNPSLLLLDEPFASLDAPLARALQDELAALIGRSGATTLLVTHAVEEAARLADRVFVLSPRPARVIGDMRVEAPRGPRDETSVRSIADRIEALRRNP